MTPVSQSLSTSKPSGLFQRISVFLEMIKFEHSIFALPFAYLGLFLAARGIPSAHALLWVTISMIGVRTLAMTLNRLIDQKIDAENPRTKSRALPAGLLTSKFAWVTVFVAIAIYLFAASRLNSLCFRLAPITIVFVWVYPYLKRCTWASHWFLGLILGMAPYGGWLAVRPEFNWAPGLLMIAVMSWVGGFDVFYALQDTEFDKMKGLYSFPAKFGVGPAIFAGKLSQGVTIAALVGAGYLLGLGIAYWIGLFLVSAFIYKEHRLVSESGLGKINEAFFNMNAWVSVIIFLSAFIDLMVHHA